MAFWGSAEACWAERTAESVASLVPAGRFPLAGEICAAVGVGMVVIMLLEELLGGRRRVGNVDVAGSSVGSHFYSCIQIVYTRGANSRARAEVGKELQ